MFEWIRTKRTKERRHMITDEYELRRLKDDTAIAIDALIAILNTMTKDGQIHESYLLEKAGTAKRCIDFVYGEAKTLSKSLSDDGR